MTTPHRWLKVRGGRFDWWCPGCGRLMRRVHRVRGTYRIARFWEVSDDRGQTWQRAKGAGRACRNSPRARRRATTKKEK